MSASRLICTGLLAVGLAGFPMAANAQTGGESAGSQNAGSQNAGSLPSADGGMPDRGRATAGAPEAAATGVCATQRTTIKTNPESDLVQTSSTGFVNIPRSGLNFTQGGAASSCVIIRFSAIAFAPEKRVMDVRVLLDGRLAQPGVVLISGDDDEDFDGRWARSRSFEFFVPNVAPGRHSVRVQWRSFTGGPVYVNSRATVVQHR